MGLTDSHETATKNLTITRTNCQILTFIRKKIKPQKKFMVANHGMSC